MDTSILNSTKKILGIAEDYTAWDLDIITHINSAFTTLNQLGIGPSEGFMIEDESSEWDEFSDSDTLLNSVKQYIFLKVRSIFDPPPTSYLVESMERQIHEHESRLSMMREDESWTNPNTA